MGNFIILANDQNDTYHIYSVKHFETILALDQLLYNLSSDEAEYYTVDKDDYLKTLKEILNDQN